MDTGNYLGLIRRDTGMSSGRITDRKMAVLLGCAKSHNKRRK